MTMNDHEWEGRVLKISENLITWYMDAPILKNTTTLFQHYLVESILI